MVMNERLKQGIQRYEEKLRLGVNGPLTEDQIEGQVAHYGTALTQISQAVDQGRQILCARGVSTVFFPYYHAFSRELYKLTRQELPDGMIRSRFAQTAGKWIARGLDQAVLLEIASDVFLLSLPEPANT
jgi:hypothetical protein